jgi:hypothetical protein
MDDDGAVRKVGLKVSKLTRMKDKKSLKTNRVIARLLLRLLRSVNRHLYCIYPYQNPATRYWQSLEKPRNTLIEVNKNST